jgi:hypothetical protein
MTARFTITTTNDDPAQDLEAAQDIQHVANMVKGQLTVEYGFEATDETETIESQIMTPPDPALAAQEQAATEEAERLAAVETQRITDAATQAAADLAQLTAANQAAV